MCYSPEVSIGTFAFVALGAGYLWMRNRPADRGLAILFISIALMQLVEFVLWLVVDKCDDVNRAASGLVTLALVVQPLIATWGAWKYKTGWAPGYKELFYILLFLTPLTLWDMYRRSAGECVVVDRGHLAWPSYSFNADYSSMLFTAFYWFGLLYVIGTLKNVPLAVLLTAAYAWSYSRSEEDHGRAWPSVYCHAVNVLVVLAILLN